MAEFFIDNLDKRYTKAFGFKPQSGTAQAIQSLGAYGLEVASMKAFVDSYETELGYAVRNGRPIFDLIEFFDQHGNGKNGSPDVPLYAFELPPFLDCSFSKNITTTVVNDNGGEVVGESFGNQNWNIRMRGLLVEMENHHRPLREIESLWKNLCQKGMIYQVSSAYLQTLDINYLYITDGDITPLEGFKDTVSFTISAKSIIPADYVLFVPNGTKYERTKK